MEELIAARIPTPDEAKKKKKPESKLCVLFENDRIGLTVCVLNTTTLSLHPLSSLPSREWPQRPGYITLHSKIYIIGGHFLASDGELLDDALDIYPDLDFAIIKYPRRVLVLDINTTKDNNNKWEEGPPLNGPKPNPLVVAFDGRIYALAGSASPHNGNGEKNVDPVFEVLHHPEQAWRVLPSPPFQWIYDEGDGPRFTAHLVIPPYLYVLIDRPTSYPSQLSAWEDDIVQSFLYCFDMEGQVWCSHFAHKDIPIIFKNLLAYDWDDKIANVADHKMFHLDAYNHPRILVYAVKAMPVQDVTLQRKLLKKYGVFEDEERFFFSDLPYYCPLSTTKHPRVIHGLRGLMNGFPPILSISDL